MYMYIYLQIFSRYNLIQENLRIHTCLKLNLHIHVTYIYMYICRWYPPYICARMCVCVCFHSAGNYAMSLFKTGARTYMHT